MNKRLVFGLAAACVLAAACDQKEQDILEAGTEYTTFSVSLDDETKTSLGESVDGTRSVYWSNGDRISLNGTASDALSGVGPGEKSATFTVPGIIDPPFNVLYPADIWKNASTITLPAVQSYEEGTFASGAEPLAGYSADGSAITIGHLCSIIMLKVKKDAGVTASSLVRVTFQGNAAEQVSGDFTIDYEGSTLSGASSADEDKSVSLTLSEPLSESSALELFLVVPATAYTDGFTVVLEDDMHRTMTKTRSSAKTMEAGKLVKMSEFSFVPSPVSTELGIDDITEDVVVPDGYNVTGRVVDGSGNGIAGVVVSDGAKCVRTLPDGSFFIESEIASVTFVHVSTPSGYMPTVSGGIPRFYKAKADVTPAGGIYDFGDFVLTPVANPDTYTLFITADPQPRASANSLDNVAYRSLRACESLYRDLKETAAAITDRQVYGICLGDLVHEDMDLLDTYASALGTLGYPTYNLIGNHDNDPAAADDDAAAWKYESLFGPRNYSFNIGGIHYVVLDNLIMKDNGSGKLTAYDQGLTDAVWKWFQNDMAFVPASSTVMVCAHSPMFKLISGSERSNTAAHGTDYGNLLDRYAQVHAWAGHTHTGFNYIYPGSHRHKKIEVHTLARSTGELWTNEYLAAGTPRGFTIVEVENGSVTSWKFHPTKYLRSDFHGTYGQPSYNYADWTFSTNDGWKVATMKGSGLPLDEDYQMHVYTPGVYEDGYVYANIFLWDSLWGTPTLSVNGGSPVEMVLVDAANSYDAADKEIRDFYYNNYSLLRSAGYTASAMGETVTVFKAPAPVTGTGTVSVTDRFGNVYTRSVSW